MKKDTKKKKQPSTHSSDSLVGHLLVATPQMTDNRFRHAVILICRHDLEAAMGLMVNRPNTELSFQKLAKQLNLNSSRLSRDKPVFSGGPVEPERGYILHSDDQMLPRTAHVTENICLSVNVGMIREIAHGVGPTFSKVMLGCAMWTAGQLEDELRKNMWVNLPATQEFLFKIDPDKLWERSFKSIGLNPAAFSPVSGTA